MKQNKITFACVIQLYYFATMRKEKQTQPNNCNPMLRAGKLLLITGISLMFSVGAFAQDINQDPDDSVPFDGGVSLLVAAGVAYGAKRWRDSRTDKKEANSESYD